MSSAGPRMRTWCALVALAVLSLAGCATRREARVVERSWEPRAAQRSTIAPAPSRRGASPDHVVVRGDTLHAIAFARGVSVSELATWNSLSPPYTIYPGQRLRVGHAGARMTTPSQPARRYPVRPAQPMNRETVDRTRPTERYRDEPLPAPRRAPPPPPPPGAPITTPLDDGGTTTTQPVDAAPPSAPPARGPAIPAAPTRSAAGIAWRWPAAGGVATRFSAGDPARQGVDIRGKHGDPVVAAADGEVVYSGSGLLGYGELIIVKHAGEFLSAYAYNRKRLVAEGDRVSAGQPIAEMGRRGGAIDLVHFEIRRGGRPVDPLQFLPPR